MTLEKGSLEGADGTMPIAIVASWSPSPRMSRSLSEYVTELSSLGFKVVVVSVAEVAAPLEWPHGFPGDATVLRRRNVGYDFGTWAAALNGLSGIRSAPEVLLTNDSMVGPFRSIQAEIESARSSSASLVGMTDSFQAGHSVQSYFMHFKNGVLADEPWKCFFDSIRPQKSKMDVVFRYELGAAAECTSGAYGWKVLYSARLLDSPFSNPTITGWRPLLEQGFPFVKRTLWTDPALASFADQATRYLQDVLGIDVYDWLPDYIVRRRSEDAHEN